MILHSILSVMAHCPVIQYSVVEGLQTRSSLHFLDLPLLSHYLQFVKLADFSLAFPHLLFPSSALFHFPDLPQALYIYVPIPQLVSSWLAMTFCLTHLLPI